MVKPPRRAPLALNRDSKSRNPKPHQSIYGLLAPFFLCFYLILLTSFRGYGEISPFFSWSLFSHPPAQAKTIVIEFRSIDGLEPAIEDKFIGAYNHPRHTRLRKALLKVFSVCARSSSESGCDHMVETIVFPLIQEMIGNRQSEFLIVLCLNDFEYVKKRFKEANTRIPIFTSSHCHTRGSLGPFVMGEK
jgi:hypothetical protein